MPAPGGMARARQYRVVRPWAWRNRTIPVAASRWRTDAASAPVAAAARSTRSASTSSRSRLAEMARPTAARASARAFSRSAFRAASRWRSKRRAFSMATAA
jgi:hypothetical protein